MHRQRLTPMNRRVGTAHHDAVARLRWWAVPTLLLLLLLCTSLQAQQARPPQPAAVVIDPLVRDLLTTNPTTPGDILRVLDVLIELRQAKAGEPLLKQLVDLQLDDAKLAALYGEFGAGFFLKLARTGELNPTAGQFADKVMAAAKSRSATRNKSISSLSS
jgi:hypothetical protein